MRKTKRIFTAAVSCVVAFCACISFSGTDINNQYAVSADSTYTAKCDQMLEIINKHRIANGVAPLELYISATGAANTRAEEIIRKFDHQRPNGKDFYTVLDNCHFTYWAVGENIAMGSSDVELIMDLWMNSEGHKANILNSDYQWVAIGNADDIYWSQVFLGNVSSSSTLGDPNGDGTINSIDASLALGYYAYTSTTKYFNDTAQFKTAANVNKDSTINAIDASIILKYYAESSTGGKPSLG